MRHKARSVSREEMLNMSKLPPKPEPKYTTPLGKVLWTNEQMDEYALAAIEAYKASLNPQLVAWIEGPHGAIRANPEFKISGPQTIGWRLPIYLLDDQP